MTRLTTTAALLAACALAACGTTKVAPEPIIVTKEVPVAVATSCVPKNLAPAPKYPDTNAALAAAGGPDDRYQLVAAGRELRIGRLAVLEPVVAGCPR